MLQWSLIVFSSITFCIVAILCVYRWIYSNQKGGFWCVMSLDYYGWERVGLTTINLKQKKVMYTYFYFCNMYCSDLQDYCGVSFHPPHIIMHTLIYCDVRLFLFVKLAQDIHFTTGFVQIDFSFIFMRFSFFLHIFLLGLKYMSVSAVQILFFWCWLV